MKPILETVVSMIGHSVVTVPYDHNDRSTLTLARATIVMITWKSALSSLSSVC